MNFYPKYLGFKEIEIIDLDTIDISNLNRQVPTTRWLVTYILRESVVEPDFFAGVGKNAPAPLRAVPRTKLLFVGN